LAQVLKLIPPVTDPNILVGLATADDAAVYRLTDDLAVVLTVDYFTPIVDDAYDFGRIAATNALSDIYAMGARPLIALNLVGFPSKTQPISILEDILRGGADQAGKAGVNIVGGHSIDDPEPKYGLVVLGTVHPERVMSNSGARIGDRLFLTKPIGTGIISTAIKVGECPPEVEQAAIGLMTTLNREAAEAMIAAGANACTDVTGFGLLGHLHELIEASGVGARINASAVPIIPGVRELLAEDMVPGGTERNLDYLETCSAVQWEKGITEEDKLLLSDAQTAGGLLISIPAEHADRLRGLLEQAQTPAVAEVGEIVEGPPLITVAQGD
jgi:selenide, water dikinase